VIFSRGDTRDIPKLWTLLRGVDCVYHLAARVSVPESVLYPVEYNDVNVGGTVSVMTAVRDAQVRRVIFTSSGAAYGEQEHQPISEDTPLRPQTPYAVSKMAAEQYVLAIGALWEIETVILRVFNAYGPGQPLPPSHAPVIPQFLKQALEGGSLVVYGSGRQTRDFVYIGDVVDALVAAAETPDIDRSIMNIGSGTGVSIKELVDAVAEATGRRVHRLSNPSQSGGVSRLVADISLAQAELAFSPKVSLREGLRHILAEDPIFNGSR
jgi:UDP-glucose 4-epimerase